MFISLSFQRFRKLREIFLCCLLAVFSGQLLANGEMVGNEHLADSWPLALKEVASVIIPSPEDGASAEILTFHAPTQQLFSVNSMPALIEVFRLSEKLAGGISLDHSKTINVRQDLAAYLDFKSIPSSLGVLTSIDSFNGRNLLVASITSNLGHAGRGYIAFYRATDAFFIGAVEVGFLPDMVTFTPDGSKILVANEGEPSADYEIDPSGSISIIHLPIADKAPNQTQVKDLGLLEYLEADALSEVRISPMATSIQQDIEPEYIAISPDGLKAYVTLQENNAIATVDLVGEKVIDIWSLGTKDHSVIGQGLDASDEDGIVNIRPWPVQGLYMPDAIAAYEYNDRTFLVTANEGDVREYGSMRDWTEVDKLSCSLQGISGLSSIPDINNDGIGDYRDVLSRSGLGSLQVEKQFGKGNEPCADLLSFGTRSFSIWDSEKKSLVYDSGDQFESILALDNPHRFNDYDRRSDNRGPEPEAVALAILDQRTFAFIGLERAHGIMSYEITNPRSPRFIAHYSAMGTGPESDAGQPAHRGPEFMEFIGKENSPTNTDLLAVSYEYSASIVVYEIVTND